MYTPQGNRNRRCSSKSALSATRFVIRRRLRVAAKRIQAAGGQTAGEGRMLWKRVKIEGRLGSGMKNQNVARASGSGSGQGHGCCFGELDWVKETAWNHWEGVQTKERNCFWPQLENSCLATVVSSWKGTCVYNMMQPFLSSFILSRTFGDSSGTPKAVVIGT